MGNPGLRAVASFAALDDESRPKRKRGKCLTAGSHWMTWIDLTDRFVHKSDFFKLVMFEKISTVE